VARAASKRRKQPGPARRMARSTLRVAMLAGAVLVGRRTAGGGRAERRPAAVGGGTEASGGLGAAAGGEPSASHRTDAREVADDGRGRFADVPRQIPPRGWKDIAKRTAKSVKEDQVPLLGAGVAFYALLSLFPAIIAGVSIYGLVADPDTVRDQINEATEMLSPETASILQTQIEQITGGAGGALGLATVIGILTALWSASSGMKALITGVTLAYDETETRKFVKLRGLSLGLTLGAMVLMAIALALIVGFPAVASSWPTPLAWTAGLLRWVLLAVLVIGGLAVLYRVGPDRDQPRWNWASWGSVLATVLWILASIGFSIYASSFGNYNKTYGALAGIIILMFWLYLTAVIVLLGAELNTEMELQTARDTTTGPSRPMGERDAHAADHVAESPAARG
jgi:membrane protein